MALLRVTQGVYFMMGTGIELTDRTGAYPLVSLAGLITVVAGAYLLIEPLRDRRGAGRSAVLGRHGRHDLWTCEARFDIKYDWPTIGCFTLLSVGCVLAGYGVQPWDLWTRLAVYLAISLAYPVLALLLLVRSPSGAGARTLAVRKTAVPASIEPYALNARVPTCIYYELDVVTADDAHAPERGALGRAQFAGGDCIWSQDIPGQQPARLWDAAQPAIGRRSAAPAHPLAELSGSRSAADRPAASGIAERDGEILLAVRRGSAAQRWRAVSEVCRGGRGPHRMDHVATDHDLETLRRAAGAPIEVHQTSTARTPLRAAWQCLKGPCRQEPCGPLRSPGRACVRRTDRRRVRPVYRVLCQ